MHSYVTLMLEKYINCTKFILRKYAHSRIWIEVCRTVVVINLNCIGYEIFKNANMMDTQTGIKSWELLLNTKFIICVHKYLHYS